MKRIQSSLGFIAILGIALKATHGHYDTFWIFFTTILFLIWFGCQFDKRELNLRVSPELILHLLLVVECGLLSANAELLYIKNMPAALLMQTCIFLALVFSFVSFVRSPALEENRGYLRINYIFLFGCGMALMLARWYVLRASPSPFVDVFTIDTAAVDHFLAGNNPYRYIYKDIYQGAYGYSPGYTYWPAYLFISAGSRAVFGDIRAIHILSDLAFAILAAIFWKRAGGRTPGAIAAGVCTLAFPTTLFVLEQAWNDSLICTLAAVLLLCIIHRKWWLAGAVAALLTGIKQYAFIPVALLFLFLLKTEGWRTTAKTAIIFIAMLLASFLPFLLKDFSSFYVNTMQLLADRPNRYDSFSVVALVANLTGWAPSGTLLLLFYATIFGLGMGWLALRKSLVIADVFFANAAIYGGLLLMGKQAFCNYYTMLALFIFLYLALIEKKSDLSSTDRQFS